MRAGACFWFENTIETLNQVLGAEMLLRKAVDVFCFPLFAVAHGE